MAAVKWIKIVTDIFDDEKIQLIESMPDADSIIVIWFKLLCMAGKQNNGGAFMLNDRIAYTDEMLSTIFRRPLNTVRLALSTFEQFGMIEIVNNTITIPNWGKHQNLEGIERSNEQARLRMQKYRERQKLLTAGNVTERNSYVTVTQTDKYIDKDKEEDKEIDKEEGGKPQSKTYKTIVDFLNEKAGTNYKATSEATRKAINARLNDGYTIADFETVIEKKCAEWIGTEWEKFLRPSTLFGTKFESYLNGKINKKNGVKTYGETRKRAESDAENKWGRIGTYI